jgi:hypothetical protein
MSPEALANIRRGEDLDPGCESVIDEWEVRVGQPT